MKGLPCCASGVEVLVESEGVEVGSERLDDSEGIVSTILNASNAEC